MSRGWSIVVPEGYVVSRWRVGAPIASGSWASVYEARLVAEPRSAAQEPRSAAQERCGDPELVAVKFLPTGTVTSRQLAHLADMARREQEAYRRLRHPRLVQLFDVVVIEDPDRPELDGAVALVTERRQTSLSTLAARAAGEPVADAPRILTEICEGLAYMHSAGWVHGDLKPGNVLLMADGSVRLADFGLSAELDGTHGYLPPAGTCDYQPPERWSEPLTGRGMAVRQSADIWAFGVITCLLLTGRLPFPGGTAQARAAAVAEYASSGAPAPQTDGLPSGWRDLIVDCLAPDHDRRSKWTATRVLERLRGLRAVPVSAPPWRRHRRGVLAASAGAVAAGATAATLWLTSPPAPDYAQYFRAGSDIPAQFEGLIVRAGTSCREPGVSPALVASILKRESDFRQWWSNRAGGTYGIAGWSPAVLERYLDPPVQSKSLRYAMTPALAIPALGRYLCDIAPALATLSGDHARYLAAAYRTNESLVLRDHGVPPQAVRFTSVVLHYLAGYRPGSGPKVSR